MRLLALGSVSFASVLSLSLSLALGLAVGCGQSESDGGAGNTGSATAGSNGAGTTGKAGNSATAGSTSGGSSSGGASTAGASSGGVTTGGQPDPQAGAGNEGGSASGLVDCDPKKVLCKRTPPECPAGEVPSVDENCYGDCVKVAKCACNAADQCPQPNEYTCWAKQHCGPFVR